MEKTQVRHFLIETGAYMQSIKLEYLKILILRTKPYQRGELDSQLSSVTADTQLHGLQLSVVHSG